MISNLLVMNLFRKIANFIDQQKTISQIYDDIKNLDEVLVDRRIEILDEIVTVKFAEIGLKNWNGKYLWYSDFNDEGIKHVIEYNVLKHYGGSFSYGNCFNFIPTISNSKLVNHKTEKSTAIIYHKRLNGWQKSLKNNSLINPDKISTINEEKFRSSLNKVLKENLPKLKKWFEDNNTIEQNIQSLIQDANNPPYEIGYRINSYEYILAFLYAKKSELSLSNFWLNKHFLEANKDQKLEDLIYEKIENMKPKN